MIFYTYIRRTDGSHYNHAMHVPSEVQAYKNKTIVTLPDVASLRLTDSRVSNDDTIVAMAVEDSGTLWTSEFRIENEPRMIPVSEAGDYRDFA